MKNKILFEKIGVVAVTFVFITAIFIPAVSSQYNLSSKFIDIENDIDAVERKNLKSITETFKEDEKDILKDTNIGGHTFDDVWEVTLEFSEPGGSYDNAYFGEKTDASDGVDSYDTPKSPPGMAPYIRAWFATSFTTPYDVLWKEYKSYPDQTKLWNLSLIWIPTMGSPTTITITWDPNQFSLSEYNTVLLYDVDLGSNVADMMIDSNYIFSCDPYAPQIFQIICMQNQPPNAVDDTAIVSEDSVDYLIDVLANDNDPNGDSLNITGVTTPSFGTNTFTDNYVYYTPDPNYNGPDYFTYTIDDGNGETDTATVNITVTPQNDNPVANDDIASVVEDSVNNQIDVLLNDVDIDGDTLTIISVTTPSNGSASTNGNYVFYTPDGDYNGADQFDYTIIDGNGGSDSATVFVTVSAVNDPPVANDDIATVIEDSSTNLIDVLANDVDIEGDHLDIIGVSTPAHGNTTFSSDYVYYTPDPNYNGSDQFSYTISDGQGGSDSATVYVTISPVNDPPVANDDSATFIEDSSSNQIDVLLNDNDIDGDIISIISIGTPSSGTASSDGSYVYYTPNPDYCGSDQFSYTISDGHGGTDTANIYITITCVNDAPVANDDSAMVDEDTSNNLIDVLANDIDVDGDHLDITGVTDPPHGTTTFSINYVYYTPDPNYNGSDQFSYTITDHNGSSDTATVYVTVGGTNDPPVANDDIATVVEDSSNNLIDVLINDVDIDGDDLNVTGVTNPSHGTATYDIDYVYYTPNENYSGTDSFSYTVSDGNGGTDTAVVSITITAVNDPPIANDDSANVNEDTSNNQIDVLANDIDVDGDNMDIIGVSTPSNGTAAYTAAFVYYTPNANYNGADQFTYTITDGNGETDTATVYVTVNPVNDAPIANDDSASVDEDTSGNQIDVLANDLDIDGDVIGITSVSTPTHGTATYNVDYVFYTPNPNYNGVDQFTYTITDYNGGTDTAIVNINVDPVNDNPNAVADTDTVIEDSNNNQIDVLSNDIDIDGDTLTIISITQPTSGTASFDTDFVYYTPNPNFNGADSFTYTISDGNGGSDSANVYLTITAVNDPPTAINDAASVPEDSSNNQINVLANDFDIDGDDIDIVGVTTPSHGTVTYTAAFVYYTPNTNYNGPDEFSYTISDGAGGSDTATVNITVGATNDPPIANNDIATVAEDSVNNQIDVLANDNDPDGDNITIVSTTNPSHGTVTYTADYVFYSPSVNYNGADSFTYTISDGNGGSDVASVSVTITAVNDPPNANDDFKTVAEDSTDNVIDALANDNDIDGDSLDIIGVSTPSHGTATFSVDFVYYSPALNYNGPDSFTYTISDGNGGTDTGTISVTITPVNDRPTANDDFVSVPEDSVDNQIDVLANDLDIDGDSLDIISVSTPGHGTTTFTASYVYYTPNPNYYGSDQFSYTITDNNGGTDSATVYITVTAVNDPPIANDDVATVIEDSIDNQINVLNNDNDPDGDDIDIISVTTPLHGTVSYTIDHVLYTPNSNYNGPDSFSYTITDYNGGTDVATVSVTVTAVNDLPIANDDYATVIEDSVNNQIDVLLNDLDIDGDDLDITGVSNPSHGTSTYTNNYVYYTPAPNYNGPDQFSYTITDNNGGSDSATVFITVGGTNDPPVANNDFATVDEDTINNLIDVIANDNDPDGDTLTVISVTTPSHGSALTDGTYVYYTPAPNYNGADQFTYTIFDGNDGYDTATVYVTVNPVNDPPLANDDFATVQEDSSNNQIDVLFNDNDPEGDDLTIISVTNPMHGTATMNNDYVFYTPDPNYNGSDQFQYTISDGNGLTDSAMVYVTVTGGNDPPVAYDDIAAVNEDTFNNLINVLLNDIDPDGDDLQIVGVTTPAHGITLYTADYVYYTPNSNYNGVDQFSYTVFDGEGGFDNATVFIIVNPINDPPIANNDNVIVDEDSVDNYLYVLTNDIDIDGDTLTIISISTPLHGNATNAGTFILYTPFENYVGTDQIIYEIDDGNGGNDTATVFITVTSQNDPPTAVDDNFSVVEDSSNNIFLVLSNDYDIDGDDFTITNATTPLHGTTTYTTDFIYYTPNPDYNGSDEFYYTITDDNGESDTATVNVNVIGVNDPPIANLDQVTVFEDSTNNELDVLANDIDVDGDDLTIITITQPSHGVATYTSNYIYYTPNPDYIGFDAFTYTISDGNGETDDAPILVTVTEQNDPPYVPTNPSPLNGATAIPFSTNLSWDVSDPDGNNVTCDVYLGTTNPPPLIAANISNDTYDPGMLDPITVYYWRIVAWDNHSASTVGPIWQFTTAQNHPPFPPRYPHPEDGAIYVDPETELSWLGGDPDVGDIVTYDIYLGTVTPPFLIEFNYSGTTYDPGGLNEETTYFWRIVAWDYHGASLEGPIWTFTTGVHINKPPEKPIIDGPKVVGPNVTVQFTAETTDREGDEIFYRWDWGDGNMSAWFGPYESGEVSIAEYNFDETDEEIFVRVKARDFYGEESDWSEPYNITIEKSIFINDPRVGYVQINLWDVIRPYFYSNLLNILNISVIISNQDTFSLGADASDLVHSVIFEIQGATGNDTYTVVDTNGSDGFTAEMEALLVVMLFTVYAIDENGFIMDEDNMVFVFVPLGASSNPSEINQNGEINQDHKEKLADNIQRAETFRENFSDRLEQLHNRIITIRQKIRDRLSILNKR